MVIFLKKTSLSVKSFLLLFVLPKMQHYVNSFIESEQILIFRGSEFLCRLTTFFNIFIKLKIHYSLFIFTFKFLRISVSSIHTHLILSLYLILL